MRRYDPTEPLISLHVPKTAGTSLRLSLETWFPDGRLCLHYQDTTTLRVPEKHDARGPICIHGHFEAARGYGVDDYYPDARQFIVFLRDPFERVVSLYSFIRKHQCARSSVGWRERLLKRKDATGDFIPFDDWIPFLENEKAAGRSIASPMFFPGAPDAEAVTRAMADKFVFVGITERYESSLDTLAMLLGKKRTTVHHVNRTRRACQDFAKWRPAHARAFPEEYELYEAGLQINSESLVASH